MFDSVIHTLNQIPNNELLVSYGIIVAITCTGFFPNNNDILLAAASLMIKLKGISLFSLASVAFFAWSFGENFMFFLGHFAGRKILKLNFIQKKINEKTFNRIRHAVNQDPFPIILSLRISPILRPYFYLTLGSVGLRPARFVPIHLALTAIYVASVSSLFYFVGDFIEHYLNTYKIPSIILLISVWILVIYNVGKRSALLTVLKNSSDI